MQGRAGCGWWWLCGLRVQQEGTACPLCGAPWRPCPLNPALPGSLPSRGAHLQGLSPAGPQHLPRCGAPQSPTAGLEAGGNLDAQKLAERLDPGVLGSGIPGRKLGAVTRRVPRTGLGRTLVPSSPFSSSCPGRPAGVIATPPEDPQSQGVWLCWEAGTKVGEMTEPYFPGRVASPPADSP